MMQINLCLSGTNELKTAEIIVIGTGSITRGVVYGLSHVPGVSLRVAIIGRSHAKSPEIALIANARAAIVGTTVTFQPFHISHFKAAEFSKWPLACQRMVSLRDRLRNKE
jgi:hypothetical protein